MIKVHGQLARPLHANLHGVRPAKSAQRRSCAPLLAHSSGIPNCRPPLRIIRQSHIVSIIKRPLTCSRGRRIWSCWTQCIADIRTTKRLQLTSRGTWSTKLLREYAHARARQSMSIFIPASKQSRWTLICTQEVASAAEAAIGVLHRTAIKQRGIESQSCTQVHAN